MAISYPRKQTVIIFIICIVAVGGAIFYRSQSNSAYLSVQNVPTQPLVSTNNPVVLDTDANKNGKPDWQEDVANLNTKISTDSMKNIGQSSGTNKAQENLTLTDKFGRDFFTQYVKLNQSGLAQDADTVTKAMDSIVSSAVDPDSPVSFKLKDILTTPNEDSKTFSNWNESIADALDLYTWKDNEAMLARDALANEDYDILKKIDPIITGYTKIINRLRSIPTPESATLEMAELLNAFNTLKYSAQTLKTIQSDPLRSMLGIKSFSQGSDALLTSIDDIDALLGERGIVFAINPLVLNTSSRY